MNKRQQIIVYRSVNDLIPYARNSRTHSEEQVLQIASSIKEFGFTNPVLIDHDGGIIAGHCRVMAARKVGIDQVPTIELAHLTEAQKRAYIIADNKMALNAGWDNELLAVEFAELEQAGFNAELTGFGLSEIPGLPSGDNNEQGVGSGIDYREKFSIIVECANEAEQEELYGRLVDMGLVCKVLVN